MAGFEVIVRPVVFPNIRPTSPRVLAPADDPTQGLAVISGSGGKLIDLPHSWSVSLSRQKEAWMEQKRQFDKERVYQVDQEGIIHQDNYVEIERLKRVLLSNAAGKPMSLEFSDPPKASNVVTVETNKNRPE
jgi:hypothetical protein